jgi:superfamily II DNA or RNA helicase
MNSDKMNPFPHQLEIASLIKENDRGIFDVTCGGGKSLAMMLSSIPYEVVVVLAPTKNLVSQLHQGFVKFYKERKEDRKIFILNSDNALDFTPEEVEELKEKKER